MSIAHGDEVLLELELDVHFESREVADSSERGVPSEAFEALDVSIRSSRLDPDFHGVAVLSATGLSRFLDGTSTSPMTQGPHLQLDVFALAGPGAVELVVQDIDSESASVRGAMLDARLRPDGPSVLASIAVPLLALEDPPRAGLACQVRTNMFPSWTRKGNSAGSAGHGQDRFATTSRLYSAGFEAKNSFRSPFELPEHFGFGVSTRFARSFEFDLTVR